MATLMEGWFVVNVSQNGALTPVRSISIAIEQLVEISKKEIGETLDFKHAERGLIVCTAGKGRSTMMFVPDFTPSARSLGGKRDARFSGHDGNLPHVDSTGFVSSIPSDGLLPILDVVRGLVYILETHEFPPFLDWSDPVPESGW